MPLLQAVNEIKTLQLNTAMFWEEGEKLSLLDDKNF